MSGDRLRRISASPPARIVHLGLGNFFRAHEAAYTDRVPDASQWGIAAFSGRSDDLARRMAAQGGLYSLVTRGPEVDEFKVVTSVVQAYPGADDDSWLRLLREPDLACVTLTVTEYGYRDRLMAARLVAGLAERRRHDCGPIAVMSCDNLPGNGAVTASAILQAAERSDPTLADWIREHISFPNTMVDRITPRPTPELTELVWAATGRQDECPVVTEPFSEWVIAGDFPAGRPAWEQAGVTFAAEIESHELRKLRLLNGAHSLLAYVGLNLGLPTVADAIGDARCRALVEQWWDEATIGMNQPREELITYRAQLLDRWENRRIAHRLTQIAADGSQKLLVRVVPVLRLHRAAGRLPAAAIAVIAAWVGYLRRFGADAADASLATVLPLVEGPSHLVATRILAFLDPGNGLVDDRELVSALAVALN